MSPRSIPPSSPPPPAPASRPSDPIETFAAIAAALDEHASLWRSWAAIAEHIDLGPEMVVRTAAHTADAARAERLAASIPGPDDSTDPAAWYAALTRPERTTVRAALARRLEGLVDDITQTRGAVLALGLLGEDGGSGSAGQGRPN